MSRSLSADEALRLRAADVADLAVLSACLQDAVVSIGDMEFFADEHRFVLVANRFRWEHDGPEDRPPELGCHERVLCALMFDRVRRVQCRGFRRCDVNQFLDLLAIAAAEANDDDSYVIQMTFAGGAAIRLIADGLECRMADLCEPWPTMWQPHHS